MRADKFARQKRHETISAWIIEGGIRVCPKCDHPIFTSKTKKCSNCGYCLGGVKY